MDQGLMLYFCGWSDWRGRDACSFEIGGCKRRDVMSYIRGQLCKGFLNLWYVIRGSRMPINQFTRRSYLDRVVVRLTFVDAGDSGNGVSIQSNHE